MINRMKLVSIALSVISSLVIGFIPQRIFAGNTITASAQIGKQAPNFTLPDANGKKHSLSDYKGKYVVLEWINFGCPFVGKHYDSNNMQKLQKEYTNKGVIWLSICSSAKGRQGNLDSSALKEKLTMEGWKGTAYLIDESGTTGREYGAKTTPTMCVINKQQELIYFGAIDNKRSTDVSDVPHAYNFVKVALDDAICGKKISTPLTESYGCTVKYNY